MSARVDRFRHRQIGVGASSLHVVEAGDPEAAPFLFLHGWPESWRTWEPVMSLASRSALAVAIDLPGVGESTGDPTDGSKRQLADTVHRLVAELGLRDLTLVGHDAGGMVAYAYLRAFHDLRRAVVMDTVIPGVDPWERVLRNPYLWHFAMHAIPNLPERLVRGHQRAYFDYFYDVLSPDPDRISDRERSASAEAYAGDAALTAGFSWYRAFPRDAADNREAGAGAEVSTPVLYLRGERETGRIEDYLAGLRAAGLVNVEPALVPGAGHFTQVEAPEETWRLIAGFAARWQAL
jgi:pimeloyl-ACP methyl ester carboxylesterase